MFAIRQTNSSMENLINRFRNRLNHVPVHFVRSAIDLINWESRLIGIKGARGVGKTTLLLQYIKLRLKDELHATLYVSLDNVWFTEHKLSSLIDEFVRKGGRYLFLDEVHKYNNWSQEIKNIYDDYPNLKIVFTGSSLLEILNARADLSRRAIIYNLQGFSFREYLGLEVGIHFPILSFQSVLSSHTNHSLEITSLVNPFEHFENYLKRGYYPFHKEPLFDVRLSEVINTILDIELPQLRGIDLGYVKKIKQLLVIVAESVPFIPNITKLSEKMGINRVTLLNYLYYLDEAGLIRNLYRQSGGISRLQKPDKVFLENANLMYVLAPENVNKGSLRETFFANQLAYQHSIAYTETGDFIVDDHVFEIGGKEKSTKQIKNIENGFVVSDDVNHGFHNKIPLWLFGFLY